LERITAKKYGRKQRIAIGKANQQNRHRINNSLTIHHNPEAEKYNSTKAPKISKIGILTKVNK
jgi:hypothetical protein